MILSPLGGTGRAVAAAPAQSQAEGASRLPAAPDLTFTKTVEVLGGKARPEAGDTLRYTLTLTNPGTDVQDLVIQDVLEPYLSLVPGSLDTTPLAYDQALTTDEDTPLPLTLTAWDGDGDSLTYVITQNPAHGSLTGTAPDLIYTPDPDYYGTDSFRFKVSDGSHESQPAQVSIQVLVHNDSPVCSALSLTTAEDTTGSLAPSCTDTEGDPLTYEIHGQPAHGSAAVVSGELVYTPDADYYGDDSFTYRARDPYSAGEPARVSVGVTPVNDVPTAAAQSLSLLEDGELEITLSGADVDGDPLGYTVSAVPANGSLTGTAPNLTYSPAPDYNGPDQFTFQVCEQIPTALCDSAVISLTVTPVNDPPQFTIGPNQVVPEDTGEVVVLNWATNLSPGPLDEAGQALSFRVTANSNPGLFSAGPAISPEGTLSFTPAPDVSGSATLTLQLEDDGGDENGGQPFSAPQSFTIEITEVNDAPQVKAAAFNLDENSPDGTLVGTVEFTDPDQGQEHTFAITGGNTGGAFAIDAGSGEIRVASSASLDFESTPALSLTVQVTDNGTPALSDSDTITVTLNDLEEVPILAQATFALDENSPAGTLVGVLPSGNLDAGQEHTFAIESGNTGGAFTLDMHTGELRVANQAALDFETHPVFTLVVSVADDRQPPLSSSNQVTINLKNVNEAPQVNAATFNVDENSAAGTMVGTVQVSDPDAGDSHNFAITGGNVGGAFSIDADSGEIRVADPDVLDFESHPFFSLTIRATDEGGLSATGTITIQLNDLNEAPQVMAANFSLNENSAAGTVVGTAQATDPDSGQSFTFAITGGNTGGAFTINATTGQIQVNNTAALDYEENPIFSLTVQATDNGAPALSGTNTITVTLVDVNEAPVLQPATWDIDENSPSGTLVGTVQASDPDSGQTFTFAILSGNNGAFSIDATSGEIRVAGSQYLDYETQNTHTLQARVTDSGSPALSATATITIQVNNVEEAPLVTGESYETIGNTLLEVSDGPAGAGPRVFVNGNLLANDIDPDGAGPLAASLADNTTVQGGQVNLNPDGTFTYLPPAGYQGADSFTYTVTDQGGSQTQGTVNLTVRSMVWYVKNDAPAGGSGRSNSPFNTLSAAESASAAGNTIYIYRGNGTDSGQNAGITLKQGQRLIGAGVALEVPVQVNNGLPTTTLLEAGTAPLVTNSLGPAVSATNVLDIQISGLNLSSTQDAVNIQLTSSGTGSVVIRDNTISGAGDTGIKVRQGPAGSNLTLEIRKNTLTVDGAGVRVENSSVSGLLVVQFGENEIKSGGNAVFIHKVSSGDVRISAFDNNRVDKDTGGKGIEIIGATFDATSASAGYQTVYAGTLTIGEPDDGVGGGALLLTNVRGDLSFTDLALTASGGAALQASSTGTFAVSGTGFRLAAARGTLAATGGPALDINTATLNLDLTSLSSKNSSGVGVSLSSVAGTVSLHAGSIENASGTAFNVSGGSATITYGGTITNSTGKSVVVGSNYTGTLTFAGKIDDDGAGISLAGSSGSTARYTFSGGLELTTGANPAFTASGGGTLVITGDQNTISTNGAGALSVDTVNIGSDGLTFKSISAANAATGILLKNTGTDGGLKVTGAGGAGTGGSLTNMTSACISLTNVSAIELNRMGINGCGASGLDAKQVRGLILRNLTVYNAGNGNEEHGLNLADLTGVSLIETVQITDAFENGIFLNTSTGTLNLTLRDVVIQGNDVEYGEDGFQFLIRSSARAAILVENSQFKQLRREGIDGAVYDMAVLDLTVNNQNKFIDGSGGVTLGSGFNAALRLDLSDNTFQNGPNTPINLASFDNSTFQGRVANNTIQPAGSAGGYGIRLLEESPSQMTLALEGNQISNTEGSGLMVLSTTNNTVGGSLHLSLRNNRIQAPRTDVPGAWFETTAITPSGRTICLDTGYAGQPGNNQIAGHSSTDVRLRQANENTFQLEGWDSGSTTVDDHIKAYNQINNVYKSGSFATVSAGSCRTPEAPALPDAPASQPGQDLGSAGLTGPEVGQAQTTSTRIAALAGPETLSLEIDLLPGGKQVTVTFEARIQTSLPANVWQVTNQASVTAAGFSDALLSDDPARPGSQDPTELALYRPPLASVDAYTTPEDTPLVIAAPGVLFNDRAAEGYQALLTALKESGPPSGSLVLNPDGSFRFTPAQDFNGEVQFTYRAADTRSQSAPAAVRITVTAVNDPPVLDPARSFRLDSIGATAADNPGTLVSDLIASAGGEAIRDPDSGAQKGIAITGVDSSRGSWQYSLDGGATWNALGSATPGAARLLAADARTRLRLVPAGGWVGTLNQAVRFRAWDRTFGTNGGTLNTGSPAAQNAVSAQEAAASLTLTGDSDLSLSVQAPPGPLLAGTEAEFTLTLSNAGPFDAADVTLSGQLPPGLTFVETPPQCQVSGDQFICSLPTLEVGQSQSVTLRMKVDTQARGSLALQVEAAAGGNDPIPVDNHRSVEVDVVPTLSTYTLDDQPGPEWSRPVISASPNGTKMLGEFGNETITLTLDDLPDHTQVLLTFDLYILRSWDGNKTNWPEGLVAGAYTVAPEAVIGPDRWKLAADGVDLLDTTFSNFTGWDMYGFYQSYPDNYPQGQHPPMTGARETGTLGYGKQDATYRLSFVIEHTGPSLVLEFTGSGLQGLEDESWALGNVNVSVSAGADPRPYRLYFPGVHW